MTDRELLELAAKAAGVASDGLGGCYDMERGGVWSPLADDGDAMRLEVKLKLAVFPPWLDAGDFAVASIPDGVIDETAGDIWIQETVIGADTFSAARRAIVRAAAEIGKTMP